ncbi:MAG: type II toxin-antitoxin system RelE/ParE family toxin [Stellaceae bacterium]
MVKASSAPCAGPCITPAPAAPQQSLRPDTLAFCIGSDTYRCITTPETGFGHLGNSSRQYEKLIVEIISKIYTVSEQNRTKPKPVTFLGSSQADLRAFPDDARLEAGYQLDRVQRGMEPKDWKPMTIIGPGVKEIRISEESGTFRVFYLAALADRVLVLHAFQKKSQKTPRKDIELATKRLKEWKASNGKRDL